MALKLYTGTYTGNGTAGRTITVADLSGANTFVSIFSEVSGQIAVWRTDTMPTDSDFTYTVGSVSATNVITSLSSTGFVVGTSGRSNSNGTIYHYIVMTDTDGSYIKTGSYTGNGSARSISVGFEPTFAMTKQAGTNLAIYRHKSHTGTNSGRWASADVTSNHITALTSTGFDLGTNTAVNNNSDTFHWVAFRDYANIVETLTYTGNATDNTDIVTLFTADMVWTDANGNVAAKCKPAILGGDNSVDFSSGAMITDGIKTIGANKFTLGTSTTVNANAVQYFAFAFKAGEEAGSSAPTVTTGTPTSVSYTTTTVPGNVTSDGGSAITERGIVYSSTNATPTTSDGKLTVAGTTGAFNGDLTSLATGTLYYSRAFATNANGTSYGAVETFTTLSYAVPTVTTTSATSITTTTATSGGNVTSDGGQTITARGVVYSSTNSTPTLSDGVATTSGTTGSYTVSLTSLASGTLYYTRAYATNSQGTAYGSMSSFTTLSVTAPTVTTGTVSSTTSTGATVAGNVTSDGGATITQRGIAYGTTTNPTTAGDKVIVAGTTGAFSGNLTGLTSGQLYYARAYAVNSAGTSYGANVTFTTTAFFEVNSDNYQFGSASLEFDVDYSVNPNNIALAKSTIDLDLTGKLTNHNVEFWLYIPKSRMVQDVEVRIGTDSSNYYGANTNTQHDNVEFRNGWNFFSIALPDMVETGTVTDNDINYISIILDFVSGSFSGIVEGFLLSGIILQNDLHTRNYLSNVSSFEVDDNNYNVNFGRFSANLTAYRGYAESTNTYTLYNEENISDTQKTIDVDFGGNYEPKPLMTVTLTDPDGSNRFSLENLTTNSSVEILPDPEFIINSTLNISAETLEARLNNAEVDYNFVIPNFTPSKNTLRFGIENTEGVVTHFPAGDGYSPAGEVSADVSYSWLAQQFMTPDTTANFDVRYITTYGFEVGFLKTNNAMIYADSSDTISGSIVIGTAGGSIVRATLNTAGIDGSFTGELSLGSAVLSPNTKYWLVVEAFRVGGYASGNFWWYYTNTVEQNNGLFWRINASKTIEEVLSNTSNRNGAFKLISHDLSAITPDYDVNIKSKYYYV